MSVISNKFFKYTLMPQVIPRVRELTFEGFGSIGYWIACIFANARIFPAQHPYLNPANIGRYSIRDVLAQAGMNLKLSFRHLDQIVIFALILIGCVLLMLQLGLMGFTVLTQAAHAATAEPTSFADYFLSPLPSSDISFMVMDRIFGIPDLFGSCVSLNEPCIREETTYGSFPFPYQTAFQSLLAFYSQGLMFVAALILAYHVMTLLAEMSETGTFLGKRFNHVYAPIRIIMAIGMLIPMGYGYNAAQYITLYAAKYGSGFATNGWNYYLDSITGSSTLLGSPDILLSKPNYPTTNDFIQFMSMAQTCWYAYDDFYKYKRGTKDIDLQVAAWAVRENGNGAQSAMRLDKFLENYTNLYQIQQWFGGDMVIVFGDLDPKWSNYKGNVRPFCGEITIPITRVNVSNPDGMDSIPYRYLKDMVSVAWYDIDDSEGLSTYPIAQKVVQTTINHSTDDEDALPSKNDLSKLVNNYNDRIKQIVDDAYTQSTSAETLDTLWLNDAKQYGWAGAGIWYNKIAQVNGSFSEIVFNTPTVTRYPEISMKIQEARQKASPNLPGDSPFDPNLPPGEDGKQNTIKFDGINDQQIATVMNQTYSMFLDLQDEVTKPTTGNTILDATNALFKQTGLWDLRANNTVHPLAQMAGLGKSLLTNTIIAFGSGTAAGLMGIVGKKSAMGGALQMASGFLISIAYIGLASGILLYYIVPFLPFLYFFFAVVAWAKTIFEAMVGVPLWALAHLRYDGNGQQGFPTPQAMYGYGLLLDIFLRPILIVFGLIAATTIFYALAKTFNNIFDVVVSNLAGFNPNGSIQIPEGETGSITYKHGPFDALCYTIMYAVVLYMVATSCFKMIDIFPKKILRWMKVNAMGFGSLHDEDPTKRISAAMKNKTTEAGGAVGRAAGGAVGAHVSTSAL